MSDNIVHLDEHRRGKTKPSGLRRARDSKHTEYVRFDRNYTISTIPPGFGTLEFALADMEAFIFLSAWRDGEGTKELETRASVLSPLALQIVKWAFGELNAARIK